MTQRSFISALLLGFVMLAGCRGERGPAGPPGPAGPAGPGGGEGGLTRDVFEVTAQLTSQNEFFEAFVLEPPIEAEDVVLVYLLWDFSDGTDIWRPLPVTIFDNSGTFIYNFDFTTDDFAIFIEGDFNLASLGPEWTEDQIFRIVVLESAGMLGMPDELDYRSVTEYIGVAEEDVVRLEPKRSDRKEKKK